MPLTRVSYPYVNTLSIPSANIGSLFTNAQTFASPFIIQSNSPASTALIARGNSSSSTANLQEWQNSSGTILSQVNLFGGFFTNDVISVGGINTSGIAQLLVNSQSATRIGEIVRGHPAQTSSLQEWQDSAGSVQSAVASDGTFSIKQIRNVGGSVNRLVMSDPSSTVIVNSGNTGFVGLSVRRFNDSQTGDLQQWTNSNAGTVFARVDASGNFTVQNDTPRIRALRGTATAQTTGLGADNGSGWVGSESNTQFQILTNNTARMTFAATGSISTPNSFNVTNSSNVLLSTDSGGSISMGRADNVASSPYIDFNSGATTVDFDVRVQASGGTGVIGQGNLTITGNTTVDGNLTVNGTTTTINSTTLTVDDKNIEMGAVVAGTVSTTGTVGSITGTGPWTATITNMTDTADLIVGSAITATNGTGSLGAGGTYIIASIVSGTSVTYTATGGTTPVAGTVTNITTTGATDTTANGGGIILKGATDKSILWDSTNSNFTSTEHFNLVTSKVFKINNTQVLSNTAVLGLTPTINATGYTLSGGTTAVAVTFAGGAAYTLSGTNAQTYTFPTTGGTLITGSSPTITTPTIDTINASTATAAVSLYPTSTSATITLGTLIGSTAAVGTINIGNNAGIAGGTKAINIGTAATAGTTTITIGSTTGSTTNILGTAQVGGNAILTSASTASALTSFGTNATLTTPTIDTINVSGAAIAAALWNTTLTTGSISMGGALTTGGVNIATGTAFNGTVAIATGAGTVNKTIQIGTASTAGTTALTLGSSSGATSTIQLNGAVTTNSTITTGGQLNLNYASPTIASNNASAASIFTSTVTGVTIGSSTIKTTKYPAAPSGTTTGTVTQAAQLSGYLGMPVNQQGAAATALAYTLVASDAGKMIYVQSTPTTPTITIPANSAVAFEIGTTIVVMNDIGAATNVSIAITTDTLQLVSTGAVGTRTLARYGMATLVKVTATKWIITGNGVT